MQRGVIHLAASFEIEIVVKDAISSGLRDPETSTTSQAVRVGVLDRARKEHFSVLF